MRIFQFVGAGSEGNEQSVHFRLRCFEPQLGFDFGRPG